VFGKVFCLYLVLHLLVIIVNLYALLTGMNNNTVKFFRGLHLSFFFLFIFATVYHFCNYAHYIANIVRYGNILFEHIYGAFRLCYRLACMSQVTKF